MIYTTTRYTQPHHPAGEPDKNQIKRHTQQKKKNTLAHAERRSVHPRRRSRRWDATGTGRTGQQRRTVGLGAAAGPISRIGSEPPVRRGTRRMSAAGVADQVAPLGEAQFAQGALVWPIIVMNIPLVLSEHRPRGQGGVANVAHKVAPPFVDGPHVGADVGRLGKGSRTARNCTWVTPRLFMNRPLVPISVPACGKVASANVTRDGYRERRG